MAYQVVAGITDVVAAIDAFADFAVANGWERVYRTSSNASNVTIGLRIPGVTDYIHIFTLTGADIRTRISVGYTAGQPPNLQPDVTRTDCITNALQDGNFPRTWFFANGTELAMVILRANSSAYSHVAIGALKKYGVYDGGTYADGSFFAQTGTNSGNWTGSDHALFGYATIGGYLRADCVSEGRVKFFHPISNSATRTPNDDPAGYRGAITGISDLNHATDYGSPINSSTNHLGRLINSTDDNVFSGRTFLHPIEFMVRRAGEPPYFSPVGYVDNHRYITLANFDPEQEIVVAGETWKLFPVVRRAEYSNVNNAPNASRNCGYAIRKVT